MKASHQNKALPATNVKQEERIDDEEIQSPNTVVVATTAAVAPDLSPTAPAPAAVAALEQQQRANDGDPATNGTAKKRSCTTTGTSTNASNKRKQRRRSSSSRRRDYVAEPLVWEDSGLEKTDSNLVFAAMLHQLILYKAQHGDCNVPPPPSSSSRRDDDETENNNEMNENKYLGEWVKQTRNNKHLLTTSQVTILNEIGFSWDNWRTIQAHQRWMGYLQKLVEYKQTHGHVNVPAFRTKDNTKLKTPDDDLGRWVHTQRTRYKHLQKANQLANHDDSNDNNEKAANTNHRRPTDVMTLQQKEKLEELGFQWSVKPVKGWEFGYAQLVEYKETHGHCNVPQHWPENRWLGKWVARQRYDYCKLQQQQESIITDGRKKMSAERIERLHAIGFYWGKVRPNTWKETKKRTKSSGSAAAATTEPSHHEEKAEDS